MNFPCYKLGPVYRTTFLGKRLLCFDCPSTRKQHLLFPKTEQYENRCVKTWRHPRLRVDGKMLNDVTVFGKSKLCSVVPYIVHYITYRIMGVVSERGSDVWTQPMFAWIVFLLHDVCASAYKNLQNLRLEKSCLIKVFRWKRKTCSSFVLLVFALGVNVRSLFQSLLESRLHVNSDSAFTPRHTTTSLFTV